MSSLGSLNIQLSLDTVQFQQALSKSDHQTQKFVKNFTVDMDKARNSARQFADRTTDYLRNIEDAAKNINTATKWEFRINNFERVQALASSFIQIADKSTELSNKLKLVTDDEIQHAQAMSAVYDISMKTAQSTQAVSAIYSSFSQNAKELGINQQQVASVTETISKAVAISGASASEAQNALTQFSQTLLMGKMRAQEYNSIMTQTPAVMQAIARGLGVTMGELKQMSDDGKLTSDKMIQALEKSKASVDELYGKTATTVSNAMQNLTTATEKFIGEVDKTTGVSSLAATGINTLAQNLNTLIPLLLYAGTAFAGMKLQVFTAQTWQLVNAKVQDVKTTAEQAQNILFKTQARSQEVTQELKATQAYIANLQAQMNLARTEQQRSIIARELHIQTQRETALIQQQTVAIKALETAQNQANIAKRAGLGLLNAFGGPWGIAIGLVSAGAMWLYNWHQEAEQAREKALAYADSIEQVRANLEKMSAVQVAAEMVKVKQSIHEQEEALAKLRQEQERLADSAKTTNEVIYDAFGGNYEVVKTAEELSRANDELTLKTAEVEKAQNKLNQTLEWQRDLQAHEPVSEIKDQIVALFPEIDRTTISVDGLNVSIGNFSFTIPDASNGALDFASSLNGLAKTAFFAAQAVANLNAQMGGEAIDPKHLKTIEQLERNNAITLAEGKKKIELQVANAMINSGLQPSNPGYERMKAAYQAQFEQQAAKGSGRSGGGKPKTLKSNKSGEDYRNDWDKYYDDLVNANATAWEKIRYEQEVAARELDKHLSHGVVSQAEAEKARALITEQYSKQRRELAGQYAPEIAAQEQLKQQLQDITQLRENEALTAIQAIKAREKAQYDYAQNVAQNAVNPLAQFNAQFDPYQEIENQRTRDLALLDAMQDSNGQKLLAEEDYQQKRQQIIDKYDLERQKKEADYYTQSTQMMSSAFDTMAGVMKNAAGQQSAAYKAMFAVSKAFAIAEASIKLSQAISQAMADPTALTPVQKFANMAAIASAGANLVSQITSIGFSGGGYTGDGGKYVPAGIVHKGEYVITKEATARLGKGYLDYLNYGKRGFANGGGVAVPTLPTMYYQPSQANTGRISVNVINNGEPMEANVSQKERNGQMEITVELMRQIARNETNSVLQSNFRAGGMFT